MTRTRNDRPYGWPAEPAASRHPNEGDTASALQAMLTYDQTDRRMREASNARLAATASRGRSRDGYLVRFRGRLGRAIMAFGTALGGESMRMNLASARGAVGSPRPGVAEPGR